MAEASTPALIDTACTKAVAIEKKGGLTGSHFLEGGCWERGSELFRG